MTQKVKLLKISQLNFLEKYFHYTVKQYKINFHYELKLFKNIKITFNKLKSSEI